MSHIVMIRSNGRGKHFFFFGWGTNGRGKINTSQMTQSFHL